MRAVNLLPDAPRGRRRRRLPGPLPGGRAAGILAVAGALAVLGGLGYAGHDARQDADRLAERVAEADARRAVLRAELADFRQEDAARRLQEARRGAIISLVTGRTDWERLIRDVATVLPAGVWLVALTTEPGTAPAEGASADAPDGGTPPAITVEGIAPDQDAVAAMMARLGVVAGISRPRLVSTAAERVEGREMVRFIIAAGVDQRAQGRAQLAPVAAGAGEAP